MFRILISLPRPRESAMINGPLDIIADRKQTC